MNNTTLDLSNQPSRELLQRIKEVSHERDSIIFVLYMQNVEHIEINGTCLCQRLCLIQAQSTDIDNFVRDWSGEIGELLGVGESKSGSREEVLKQI